MGVPTISRDAVAFFDKLFDHQVRVVALTGSTSYATGGDTFTPEMLSLGKIEAVVGAYLWNGSAVLWGVWDPTNKKLLFYSATGTEVTNATNLSTYSGRFLVVGK